MYISRESIKDYPYIGRFYKVDAPDTTVPLDQRTETETLVFESECDIQEVSKANNPVLIATFAVYLPYESDEPILLRRGMRFEGDMKGIDVSGEITNVVYSQLGGIVVYVKDYDAD
jgi:hypothetical protein